MRLLFRSLLLLAAWNGSVQSLLDFDQLCDLTKPVFRIRLLKDVLSRLHRKYDIESGFAMFGVCNPTDPNMPPDCMNYNNPSVAYGSTLVPCPNDKCPPESPSSFLPGKSGFYQPNQDHALVLFGCLPPKTDYFGIQTVLYEKAKSNVRGDLDCSDALSSPTGKHVKVFPPAQTVPGSRVVVDIPWYDTRNHLSLNAVGKPGSRTKFRSLFVHVTTANKQVARDITKAFIESGVPSKAINVDSIPNLPEFHLEGNSEVHDSFRTIYRVVLPKSVVSSSGDLPSSSTDEMNKYIAFEHMNILVRYLTPKAPIRKNGFAPQTPTARTVGQKEIDIVGRRSFLALLSAVNSRYGDPDYVSKPIPIIADMKKCLQGCYGYGVNMDTVYINTDKSISLAGGDFAVVCGANHVRLQYAVYTSVGIFNTSGLAVGLITDEMKLNSARRFAPVLPNVDKFYCYEIRSECHDAPYCTQPMFANTKTVLVQYRINLNPHTKTGPSTDELIWPVILGYRGNNNQE